MPNIGNSESSPTAHNQAHHPMPRHSHPSPGGSLYSSSEWPSGSVFPSTQWELQCHLLRETLPVQVLPLCFIL